MGKQQFFGLKYPFENESDDKHYLDLNDNFEDGVKSDLLHVIFTQKGTRYRNPDFGTDIIKYLFEPNDTISWDKVKNEINTQVSKYVPAVSLRDISIMKDTKDGNIMYAIIKYSISKGDMEKENKIKIRIS